MIRTMNLALRYAGAVRSRFSLASVVPIALVAGILTLLTGVLWLGANWAGVYGQGKESCATASRPETAIAPDGD